jgi:hypothetical protein
MLGNFFGVLFSNRKTQLIGFTKKDFWSSLLGCYVLYA